MSHYETIWTFKTKNFAVTLDVAPEDMDPADSFEFDEDIQAIRNGDVDWFVARVAVRFNGSIIGDDYLGGCAYRSVHDFRKDSGYFNDMVRQAVTEARKELVRLQSVKVRQ